MTLVLDNRRVDAYLRQLGSPEVRFDREGLGVLQAAHLMAVPFHNLRLLANDGQPYRLPPLHDVVDGAIAGIGGNCDRTTPSFTILLQALGFDAHLAAATVKVEGDHFVCVARVGGTRLVCDVGNGHPYLRPWDLDGPVQEQSFLGWSFRFDPCAAAGPTLTRCLSDDRVKTVYVVDPSPRSYDEFAPMVSDHYTKAGFGPFMSALRAVVIRPDAVLTLRDCEYARDTRFGRSVRQVIGRDAIVGLLVERFGLPADLVEAAVANLVRRCPDRFDREPAWLALGRGGIMDSVGVEPPARDAVPDVLVSLATVGRVSSVSRLLDTLANEVRESCYPGRVGVLVVENHEPDGTAPSSSVGSTGVYVHRVPVHTLRPALDRAAAAGILPSLNGVLPVPIGAAREAQLAAIRAHLDVPITGLPHPAKHPTVVWMVDDDVAFQQLGPDGTVRRHTNLLFRIARFWSTLPTRGVLLGTFTGDPPVPGLDCLGGQLCDLAASTELMLAFGPDVAWEPPASPPPGDDFYYDLTESRDLRREVLRPYAPDLAGRPVREVALSLLQNLPRLLDGQQLTRALAWDGEEVLPHPSLRRGGNSVFLDVDTLFRWPTPALRSADGVVTRRADTLWAALANSEDPVAVAEVTLPLLHGRDGQGRSAALPERASGAGARAAAQVRGVVLARALSEGRVVATELRAREARVSDQRQRLRDLVAGLRQHVVGLDAWGDAAIKEALPVATDALDGLDELAALSVPLRGDANELDAFLARLPSAVRAWRDSW